MPLESLFCGGRRFVRGRFDGQIEAGLRVLIGANKVDRDDRPGMLPFEENVEGL